MTGYFRANSTAKGNPTYPKPIIAILISPRVLKNGIDNKELDVPDIKFSVIKFKIPNKYIQSSAIAY
jgi:hypothetical protein